MSEIVIPLPDYNPEVIFTLPWYWQVVLGILMLAAGFAIIWLIQSMPRGSPQ